MTITPTSLIAVAGLVKGSGLTIPPELTNAVSAIQNNPLITSISALTSGFSYGGITLPAAMSSLPSSLTQLSQLQSTASGILTQAMSILPAGGADPSSGIKSFISVFNTSTAFGSSSAEYFAALSQFGNKSFAELGVNMSNFQDVISNGTSSMTKGLGALANKASIDAFGSMASVLDPNLLAKGQAMMKSSALTDGLQSMGSGLKNFGTLFDFSTPTSLGPKNLIDMLQKQGLADRNGINDMIDAAGFDPTKLSAIPESVLNSILGQVKGSDLDKIIKQTGANPLQSLQSAAGLLQASNLLPPQAMAAMGLISKGPAALKAMGSTLTNLGTSIDNFNMGDLMNGLETQALQYLGQVTQLIPTSVKAAMSAILGSGGGLFGNPQLKDMLGTVAGVGHTDNLTSSLAGVVAMGSSAAGAALKTATSGYATAVKAFIDANPGAAPSAVLSDPSVAAATAALTSATTGFQSAVSGNLDLSKLATGIGASVTASATQLAGEVDNLAKAGLAMVDNLGASIVQSFNKSYQSILAFGSKLHKMGTDIQNLGYNDFLPNMSTLNAAGDALKASLVEGRNVARAATVDQPPVAIADEKKEISAAQSENLDGLKAAYMAAAASKDKASKDLFNYRSSGGVGDPVAISKAWEAADDAKRAAKEAMDKAAQQAGVSASSLPVYQSNNSFN